MKKLTLFFAAVFSVSLSFAQTPSETEMKTWMEYMTPGDMHKLMSSCSGTWEAEITMWMASDQPPTKSKGRAVYEMIMGGRYQQGKFTGEFSGMPFEGMGLLGYDNIRKEFESVWVDNMGTGTMFMRGTIDSKSKMITFKGKMIDPMAKKETDVKQIFKFVDENTQVLEMYVMQGGKEFKTMEISYKKLSQDKL